MDEETRQLLARADEELMAAQRALDESSKHKVTSDKHLECIGAAKWFQVQARALLSTIRRKAEG